MSETMTSEIKALENLRKFSSHEVLQHLIDAVQAEIDERFMELPVDADGVPWTLETESFVDDTGAKVVFSGLEVDYTGRWKIRSNCVLHDPSLCRHVKPRTLEDVLADVVTLCANTWKDDESPFAFYGVSDVMESGNIKEYADEIRELMKEGGDD